MSLAAILRTNYDCRPRSHIRKAVVFGWLPSDLPLSSKLNQPFRQRRQLGNRLVAHTIRPFSLYFPSRTHHLQPAGRSQCRSSPPAGISAAGRGRPHHLNLGHGLAAQALRSSSRPVRVSVTLLLTDVEAASDHDEDVAAARRLDGAGNRLFLDPLLRGQYPADMLEHYAPTGGFDVVRDGDLETIQAPLDALGVNHYHHSVVASDPDDPQLGIRVLPVEGPTTSYGWGYTPDSLRRVLVRVSDEYTKLPLYVTESGASLHDYVDPEGRINDVERIDYLSRYFAAAAQAISEGVDLRGYFVWSLFDNFEWQHGYSMRFGLFYIEFSSQRRIPKASAHWYRQFITTASSSTPA
jgi:beta-glucosidase